MGVIGAGNVGGTLGTRWAQAGHDVTFGVRDPQSAEVKQVLTRAGSRAKAASVRDAAQANEVVVLATPWPATRDAIQTAGTSRARRSSMRQTRAATARWTGVGHEHFGR